jgi:hypothetical protein
MCWRHPGGDFVFETRSEDIKMQYELLNILDGKASALLSFNAIMMASVAIWLGYVSLNFMHLALDIVFLLMLFSCMALLNIIWLRWATPTENEAGLNAIRIRRTRRYHIAWRLSMSSLACLVVVSVVHTVGTVLVATNTCNTTCQAFFSEDVFGNLDYGQ